MFDIRMKKDVLRDLHLLNDAVLELEEKEKMLSACLLRFPIKEIKPIMLNDYADNLKVGDTIIIHKLENGNLNVITYDELLDKINEIFNIKDNDIWSMKLD